MGLGAPIARSLIWQSFLSVSDLHLFVRIWFILAWLDLVRFRLSAHCSISLYLCFRWFWRCSQRFFLNQRSRMFFLEFSIEIMSLFHAVCFYNLFTTALFRQLFERFEEEGIHARLVHFFLWLGIMTGATLLALTTIRSELFSGWIKVISKPRRNLIEYLLMLCADIGARVATYSVIFFLFANCFVWSKLLNNLLDLLLAC